MLAGRSGVGFGTLAPLRPTEILAFAKGMDIRLQPYEFTALLMLDGAARAPEEKDEKESEEPQITVAKRTPAWPMRKNPTPE